MLVNPALPFSSQPVHETNYISSNGTSLNVLICLISDATTTEQDYKVGTLVVDLFDAKTEKLLWRSSSTDSGSSP